MNNRDELLRTMLSKNITPEEFSFDRLTAPPVQYFLSPQDIQDLIYLANSIKYNAKINYKYEQIDKILKNRGFVLLGRGTNRVVYRYLENNTICLKVAVDHVGCSDNPREFINQEYLKPYVSKIFDYDPSGTIAVAERVHPISTREEFAYYAEGIYELITKWFIGKYVVNDIGTKYFMNWGIRYSTGMPVLLDFPYFYLLDIRKAKCMSILEDGTICGGDIDYDDGYNTLSCTKCGRSYKAADLAKDDLRGASSIITEGFKNMKSVVSIKRNGKIEKVTISPETKKLEDQYNNVAKVSTRTISRVIEEKNAETKARNFLPMEANLEKSEGPKVNVQTRKNKISIVINEENKKSSRENYKTDGHFKPEKKKTKKVRVNPLKKDTEQKLTETHFEFDHVDVSTKGKAKNPIKVPEEVVEEVVKIEEVEPETTEVKVEENITATEEIEISSAEDESAVINEDGIHIEDESTTEEEESLEEDPDATEIVADSADSEEEVVNEIVEEDPTDVEATEEEEDVKPNLADIINEAIKEETDAVMEAADSLESDAEIEEIMVAEQEIREEREAKKSSSKSKKFDPEFYGGKKRKTTKKEEEAEE